MLVSTMVDDKPIGWGALSGLAADAQTPGVLYAVNDSFYAMQPRIFTIDTNTTPAQVTSARYLEDRFVIDKILSHLVDRWGPAPSDSLLA